jgi:hypothetical protein
LNKSIKPKIYNGLLIRRLEDITTVLKNRYMDDIYMNGDELNLYYNRLKEEQNDIFKIMILDGRWGEYMNITRDFTGHTYY